MAIVLGDLVSAIMNSALVMLFMMVGSAIGEEVASFVFGKVKGGVTQILYLAFFLPIFVLGGYVFAVLKIPQTLTSSGLFFGLWGFVTVFVSRFLINQINKFFGIKLKKSDKRYINGKILIKYLKDRGLSSHDTRVILRKCCDSGRKADKIFEGGNEWVNIDPEALTYELTKKGLKAEDVMNLLGSILKMKPEEAALVWKKASV